MRARPAGGEGGVAGGWRGVIDALEAVAIHIETMCFFGGLGVGCFGQRLENWVKGRVGRFCIADGMLETGGNERPEGEVVRGRRSRRAW